VLQLDGNSNRFRSGTGLRRAIRGQTAFLRLFLRTTTAVFSGTSSSVAGVLEFGTSDASFCSSFVMMLNIRGIRSLFIASKKAIAFCYRIVTTFFQRQEKKQTFRNLKHIHSWCTRARTHTFNWSSVRNSAQGVTRIIARLRTSEWDFSSLPSRRLFPSFSCLASVVQPPSISGGSWRVAFASSPARCKEFRSRVNLDQAVVSSYVESAVVTT